MAAERKVARVLKLREPVEFGSETIHQIVVYRPKGKDMRKLLKAGFDPSAGEQAFMDFACGVTEQPGTVLDELEAADWQELMEELGKFAPSGPATGSGS